MKQAAMEKSKIIVETEAVKFVLRFFADNSKAQLSLTSGLCGTSVDLLDVIDNKTIDLLDEISNGEVTDEDMVIFGNAFDTKVAETERAFKMGKEVSFTAFNSRMLMIGSVSVIGSKVQAAAFTTAGTIALGLCNSIDEALDDINDAQR